MIQGIGAHAAALSRRIVFGMLGALAYMPVQADTDIFRDKFISLATSSRSGTFHLVGTKLCDAVNRERKTSLIRCVTYNTIGSEYNAKAVAYGEHAMGITRPDIAHAEYSRKNQSELNGAGLRAVMSLHATPVMMIARRGANISDANQIAGKSINLGNRGSSQRITVELLLKNMGLTPSSFSAVTELHTTTMGDAFCQGKVDVIVESLGNPSPFYKRMIEECNGVILAFPPALIDKILAANPLMTRLAIPGGLYAGYSQPVPTFGFRAMLVTRQDVSEEAVYRFVSSVMNGLEDMKKSDPALQDLDAEKMFIDSIAIPLHPGVLTYLNQRKTAASNVKTSSR